MIPQQIETNLNIIKTELEREVGTSDITAVQDKLLKLTAYMGLSAEIMRHAKSLVLRKQQQIISANNNGAMSASILKQFIESELWHEAALLLYADRINAAITHACESLRTIISLYKEEMKISSQGGLCT